MWKKTGCFLKQVAVFTLQYHQSLCLPHGSGDIKQVVDYCIVFPTCDRFRKINKNDSYLIMYVNFSYFYSIRI